MFFLSHNAFQGLRNDFLLQYSILTVRKVLLEYVLGEDKSDNDLLPWDLGIVKSVF